MSCNLCTGVGAARPPPVPHSTSPGSAPAKQATSPVQAAVAPLSNKNAAQLLRERILQGEHLKDSILLHSALPCHLPAIWIYC